MQDGEELQALEILRREHWADTDETATQDAAPGLRHVHYDVGEVTHIHTRTRAHTLIEVHT